MMAKLELNISKIKAKISGRISEQVQPRLDTQILKDSNFYAPEDTGLLKSSGITASKIGSGIIEWNTPYAREQYYGKPNKSKDKNPNARMKWFEVAKKTFIKEWLKLANLRYRGR